MNYADPFGLCRLHTGIFARVLNFFDGACATRDEAATRALNAVGTGRRWEYSGEIVADPEGGFRYSKARTLRLPDRSAVRPEREGYEGAYHNHIEGPGHRPEEFSDRADKRIADEYGKPVYILTPSGLIKRYDPDPEKKRGGNETVITRVP